MARQSRAKARGTPGIDSQLGFGEAGGWSWAQSGGRRDKGLCKGRGNLEKAVVGFGGETMTGPKAHTHAHTDTRGRAVDSAIEGGTREAGNAGYRRG